jgi:hypothetical protein
LARRSIGTWLALREWAGWRGRFVEIHTQQHIIDATDFSQPNTSKNLNFVPAIENVLNISAFSERPSLVSTARKPINP